MLAPFFHQGVHVEKKTLRIILGSSSPWRRKVLADAGVACEVMSPNIDEKAIRYDDPFVLTRAIAGAKAISIAARVGSGVAIVITADQVAVFDGVIREKPVDAAQARAWLAEYGETGRPVSFISTVMVSRVGEYPRSRCFSHRVEVKLARIPPVVLDDIVSRGDILGSCGAMVVEDPVIALYVVSVTGEGTPKDIATSEQGLPLGPTLAMLAEFGVVLPRK